MNRIIPKHRESKNDLAAQLELSSSWSQPRPWSKGKTAASKLCFLEKVASNTIASTLL